MPDPPPPHIHTGATSKPLACLGAPFNQLSRPPGPLLWGQPRGQPYPVPRPQRWTGWPWHCSRCPGRSKHNGRASLLRVQRAQVPLPHLPQSLEQGGTGRSPAASGGRQALTVTTLLTPSSALVQPERGQVRLEEEGSPTPTWVTGVTADVTVTLAVCIQSSWPQGLLGWLKVLDLQELFICKICLHKGVASRPPQLPHVPLLLSLFSLRAPKELLDTHLS